MNALTASLYVLDRLPDTTDRGATPDCIACKGRGFEHIDERTNKRVGIGDVNPVTYRFSDGFGGSYRVIPKHCASCYGTGDARKTVAALGEIHE